MSADKFFSDWIEKRHREFAANLEEVAVDKMRAIAREEIDSTNKINERYKQEVGREWTALHERIGKLEREAWPTKWVEHVAPTTIDAEACAQEILTGIRQNNDRWTFTPDIAAIIRKHAKPAPEVAVTGHMLYSAWYDANHDSSKTWRDPEHYVPPNWERAAAALTKRLKERK